MSSTGKIYDSNELDRINGFILTQQEQFQLNDEEKNKKEWIVIASAIVVSSVVILLVLKKIVK